MLMEIQAEQLGGPPGWGVGVGRLPEHGWRAWASP
jgi:hypothetical protein